MKDPAPSLPEWKELYQTAVEFRDLAPWEWMYDSDMFGVQNPAGGEIGYCCVMGTLGEHFALGVYLGTQGLEGYLKIQSGEVTAPEMALLHYQTCLMASFEDREYLEKQDLSVIKSLGLKFRGRNVWPLFRSYRPDYHPWFVTAEEARFLIVALRQALEVAPRLRDNPELLRPPRRGQYLVRVPTQGKDGVEWADQWLAPEPLRRVSNTVLIDEPRIQRIKQTITARQGTWEFDFFLAPAPVQEHKDDRPYYPYMMLWVDSRTGMILSPHMAAPEVYAEEVPKHFLNLAEQSRFLPQEVCVLSQEAFDLLDPIAKRLGVKLRRSRRLGAIEEARNSLMGYMGRF